MKSINKKEFERHKANQNAHGILKKFGERAIADTINPDRKLLIKYGTVTTASVGSGTVSTDTSVTDFATSQTAFIFGHSLIHNPSSHNNYTIQEILVKESGGNMFVDVYITNAGANQTYDLIWFAFGY